MGFNEFDVMLMRFNEYYIMGIGFDADQWEYTVRFTVLHVSNPQMVNW